MPENAREDAGGGPVDPGGHGRKVIRNVAELQTAFSFPGTLLRVLDVIEDENSDRFTLARAIEGDPSLAERVVAAANSPLYITYNDRLDGSRPPVGNLPVAVLKLGFGGVRNIAFTQGLCQLVEGGHAMGVEILEHLTFVAEMARGLGLLSSRALGEDAFFAGLMHDFGKLVLLQTLPHDYLKVRELCRSRALSALQAEEELLTPIQPLLRTHIHTALAILRAHRIPSEITQAVASHHEAPEMHIQAADRWDLAGIVIAADRVAYHAGYPDGLSEPQPADLAAEDLSGLLSQDTRLLNQLAEDAASRAGETITAARLPVSPRGLQRIGGLQEEAPPQPASVTNGPRPTSALYTGVVTLLDLVRTHDGVGFHDLLVRTRLDPEVLEHTLEQLVHSRFLREIRDPSGERNYAATAEFARTPDREVLGMLATRDRAVGGEHAA
jgi:HD-like signal output (HDOD) protein